MTFATDFARDSGMMDSVGNTVLALRRGHARSLAFDCLEAATAFMEEAPYWGKAELAMWLLGPYSQVVQDMHEAPQSARPSLRQLEAEEVERLIDGAHAEVREALARLEDAETASDVAFAMITAGFVAPTVDRDGTDGWAPTTAARRLADRVLSLFVADFMTRVFAAPLAGTIPLTALAA